MVLYGSVLRMILGWFSSLDEWKDRRAKRLSGYYDAHGHESLEKALVRRSKSDSFGLFYPSY